MNVEETIADREPKYGSYQTTAAASQELKRVVYKWLGKKPELPRETTLESLDNILLKIARIITGDHDYPDNFLDISGYSELALKELQKPRDVSTPNNFRAAAPATEVTERRKEAAIIAAQPPVDNDHVAEGCEKFTDDEIAANADGGSNVVSMPGAETKESYI